jgi:exodeoxyribonuclease-3
MRLRVCTWNVNSVRQRADQAARFVAEHQPDVICMQEIKCQEHEFPADAFAAMGLPHLKIAGQKGWHGVAIASRLPIEDAPRLDVCREGHARSVAVKVAGVEIQNFYIPAGGDIPDPAVNPKFAHKLDFYARLTAEMARRDPRDALIVTGDLNVAPGEFDVWNHKYMSKIVSHTPAEIEAFAGLMAAGRFFNVLREAVPEPEKLASWWSYRAADFRQSNRGLLLDHLLLSPGLREAAFHTGKAAARVHDPVREWEKPSDHAPVSVDLAL